MGGRQEDADYWITKAIADLCDSLGIYEAPWDDREWYSGAP